MTGLNNYINALMENHSLTTESEGLAENTMMNDFALVGGQKNQDLNTPTGGFPPIIICEKSKSKESISEDDKQERAYSSHKTAVSIKDIMEKRRDITPFITL